MLQNITTLYFRQITSEGLGGLNTIRGVLRNRVTGSGVLMGNAELRYRFAPFMFLKQNWYLVINPFLDAGRVVQYYRKDQLNLSSNSKVFEMIADGELNPSIDDSFHISAGVGFKVVMNRNFIISAEWGKPFDSRDGKSGLNIGLNFIF
jgi:outer membrane protein assembly factor BamA